MYNSEDQTPQDKLEDTVLALESCANLGYSFASWAAFAVDCGPEKICMKTVIDDRFDENGKHHYYTSTRGCAMRNTSFGKIHPLGCGIQKTNLIPADTTIQNRFDIACFCNTDYCNDSNTVGVAFSVLWLNLIISMLYQYVHKV